MGICRIFRHPARLIVLAALFTALPAWADVELRVEARPIAEPIQAFITVTDINGDPVPALTAADFTVTLDGVAVPLVAGDLTLPPSQDPDQKVSVVFAMDYTSSVTDLHLAAMQTAVIAFIDEMNVGDYAALIKFNNDSGATVVQPFIEIDQGANNLALETAVMGDYDGDGSNILDATIEAVAQFAAPPVPLPPGPKAVILLTDGIDSHSDSSLADAVVAANDNGIAVFTIGVGDPDQEALDLMTTLATDTGGQFLPAPDDQAIADAYASISFLLGNEYLLTIDSDIDDCQAHELVVAVDGQTTPASATFTRRDCDVTPDAFTFTNQTGLNREAITVSNTVTISGIEAPAEISIDVGSYSIGCDDNFTSADGTIDDSETVCVRHTSSASFSTSRTTTLTIGGVSATFTTTTLAEPPAGGGGGGGGGAAGLLELLLGLSLLLLGRRRWA